VNVRKFKEDKLSHIVQRPFFLNFYNDYDFTNLHCSGNTGAAEQHEDISSHHLNRK